MSSTAEQQKGPPKGGRAQDRLRAFHEEEALARAYDVRLLRRLWPFVRPHRGFIAVSLLTLLFITGLGLLRPVVMGDVVRQAGERNAGLLLRDGVALAALLLTSQLLIFAQVYTMQLAGARTMADLRAMVFDFLQRLSLRYFDRTPVGRLVTRATSDVDAVGELFASGVLNAVGDLLSLSGIVVMMLVLDWRLSLIAFAALPLVGMIVAFVRQRSRRAYRDIRTKTARLNAFLNEQVNGITVVQAYGREQAMAHEFDEVNAAYRDANKRSIYYEAILDAAIEMVSILCIASVLWWSGLHRVGAHPVTFALVVTFTQYIKQFFEPVSMLSQRYTILQSAMSGAERIFLLLDEKDVLPGALALPAATSPAPGADLEEEALALEDVTFAYKPGFPVLLGVALRARRGEKIALVGATGAGKTTVSSLLLRLYEPQAGSVRVLGRDVRSYERAELLSHFAVVPQDVFLFAGTVLSNIAMSDGSDGRVTDRARAEEALRRIGASEIFLGRPGGLDAPVEERGANFSAGERQLLAFARAVYRDAPILVLDEATASVDSDTEARLQRALAAVLTGRTALVIAHRLSTIRAVDRIVVFHKGRVVESGTHEELLALGGVYARLYEMQSAHEYAQKLESQVGAAAG